MKINWNTVVIWAIVILALVGIFFGAKEYFKRDVQTPTIGVVDSLNNVILNIEREKLELEQELVLNQGETLKLTGQAKYYKNKYYEEKNNEHIYVVLPTSDSAKHSIVTEYFIEQNIPLHYSR